VLALAIDGSPSEGMATDGEGKASGSVATQPDAGRDTDHFGNREEEEDEYMWWLVVEKGSDVGQYAVNDGVRDSARSDSLYKESSAYFELPNISDPPPPHTFPVILLVAVFNFAGLFMLQTILNLYVSERCCQADYNSSCGDLDDRESKISSRHASEYMTLLLPVPNVISLVMTSYLGCLSDVVGRRLVAMVSVLFTLLGALGCLAVVLMGADTSIWLFIPGLVLQGTGGAMGTFLAAIFAMVADISPGSVRSRNFSLAESSLMLGGLIGPLLGGWVIGIDARLAFGCVALIYAVVLVLLATISETLAGADGYLIQVVQSLSWWKTTLRPIKLVLANRSGLLLPAVIFMLSYGSGIASMSMLMPLYAKLDEFGEDVPLTQNKYKCF